MIICFTSAAIALAAVLPGEPAKTFTDDSSDLRLAFLNDVKTRKKKLGKLDKKTRGVLKAARTWLLDHQEDDGSWDSDGFMRHDPERDRCDGAGEALHDVGITGLAALALMATGEMRARKKDRVAVDRALAWLVREQDEESGLIGQQVGHAFLYGHAVATIALAEAIVVLDDTDELRAPAQAAVDLIQKARNPYGAWRYDLPPVGDNDTSITAWMTNALCTAREAGLAIDPKALEGALGWIDEVTDPEDGRIGYDSVGSTSSRVPGINDGFAVDETEVMTAAGLFVCYLLGKDEATRPVMGDHADVIMKRPPSWQSCDMYYWYYGSLALHQVGGTHWEAWWKKVSYALRSNQVDKGSAEGSWDPDGAWGHFGGRVCATALSSLALSAQVRYRRTVER